LASYIKYINLCPQKPALSKKVRQNKAEAEYQKCSGFCQECRWLYFTYFKPKFEGTIFEAFRRLTNPPKRSRMDSCVIQGYFKSPWPANQKVPSGHSLIFRISHPHRAEMHLFLKKLGFVPEKIEAIRLKLNTSSRATSPQTISLRREKL
jgi:hypothetical protein